MFRYKFTHWVAEVFADLTHGPSTVHRADGSRDPLGSTVVLNPGDEISTPEPIEHAHLEPVDAKSAAKVELPPVPPVDPAPESAPAEKE